ncbi:MAG: peptidoglycan editing factor PgeF [Deltaproteobacteria bacterium]|nr:peptidoglycan editing factor PgeF [Deltaproteobacteria bacterium]
MRPPLLTSALLDSLEGVRHGFSFRSGGISTGPFDSLNLGSNVGDDPRAVSENRRRFAVALGVVDLAEADQVHGDRVVMASRAGHQGVQADAMFTNTPELALTIRTADCAPILIVHAREGRARRVAAVHAGWRGATRRILPRAIAELHAPPEELYVAIGPTIGFDAFEVGPEVIEAAKASVEGPVPARALADGKWRLDLVELLRAQARELGIAADRVDSVGGDTYTDVDRFFSHRRDRGVTGRHASAVLLSGESWAT